MYIQSFLYMQIPKCNEKNLMCTIRAFYLCESFKGDHQLMKKKFSSRLSQTYVI